MYWEQLVANDGLASVVCASKTSKAVAGACVISVACVIYSVLLELFVERDLWLQLRIPGLNGYDYNLGVILVSTLTLGAAVVFLASASRVQRILKNQHNFEPLIIFLFNNPADRGEVKAMVCKIDA